MGDWREEVRGAAERGDYETALHRLTGAGSLSPADFVLQGRLIQLSDGGEGKTPNEAIEAFESALKLDPEYISALIELGWLYYSVLGDPRKGREYFEAAIAVTRRFALEAFDGASRCAEEIDGESGRAEITRKMLTLFGPEALSDAVK